MTSSPWDWSPRPSHMRSVRRRLPQRGAPTQGRAYAISRTSQVLCPMFHQQVTATARAPGSRPAAPRAHDSSNSVACDGTCVCARFVATKRWRGLSSRSCSDGVPRRGGIARPARAAREPAPVASRHTREPAAPSGECSSRIATLRASRSRRSLSGERSSAGATVRHALPSVVSQGSGSTDVRTVWSAAALDWGRVR